MTAGAAIRLTEPPLVYADSSAFVKLVVDEPESEALSAYVDEREPALVTSPQPVAEAWRLLDSCLLVEVSDRRLGDEARKRGVPVADPGATS